jgi:5-methyltetrahydrofolate--homocysteine methyltransferase
MGVQAAEGMAEWLHATVRRDLGLESGAGRRFSWGYPACPEQSEHDKVARLLGFADIGVEVSDGYALSPEQTTAAIVAHHPQALYFGMKSGRLKPEPVADDVVAGSDRDPSRSGELDGDREPQMAGAAEE